ncbi:MAG: Nif3-like dinuclear metal center hexameric protein [Bacteroidetes bacterium]|jgi:dinuclear metal center YbgI/SA1388 family protein|nr:Nif3-like dinuclear metal center hexameric protein [Bacteroidota bacterium]
MTIKQIVDAIDAFAPSVYQESYDNAGLLVGNPHQEAKAALLCLDVTEDVLDEAIKKKCNLVISHHPVIFGGLKKLTGKTYIERVVMKAIQHNIALYAAHTNIDTVARGVNHRISEKIGLIHTSVLQPRPNELKKLVFFVPDDYADQVRAAIFEAGAGVIGEYDSCSFNLTGFGTFKGSDNTNPFVGEKGKIHQESETRVETIFPNAIKNQVLNALFQAHPYEEVAYDVYPLDNEYNQVGMGMIGELENPVEEKDFLTKLKQIFQCGSIRHTKLIGKPVSKVAVCGGSGSFLLNTAIRQKADVFVSADFKYHQFFDAENQLVIADIGHYESEQYTLELFNEVVTKNFPKFAVHLTEVNTNPINYF